MADLNAAVDAGSAAGVTAVHQAITNPTELQTMIQGAAGGISSTIQGQAEHEQRYISNEDGTTTVKDTSTSVVFDPAGGRSAVQKDSVSQDSRNASIDPFAWADNIMEKMGKTMDKMLDRMMEKDAKEREERDKEREERQKKEDKDREERMMMHESVLKAIKSNDNRQEDEPEAPLWEEENDMPEGLEEFATQENIMPGAGPGTGPADTGSEAGPKAGTQPETESDEELEDDDDNEPADDKENKDPTYQPGSRAPPSSPTGSNLPKKRKAEPEATLRRPSAVPDKKAKVAKPQSDTPTESQIAEAAKHLFKNDDYCVLVWDIKEEGPRIFDMSKFGNLDTISESLAEALLLNFVQKQIDPNRKKIGRINIDGQSCKGVRGVKLVDVEGASQLDP